MAAVPAGGLGVRVPVHFSQVHLGDLPALAREDAVSDLVDAHGYWQHPSYCPAPNSPAGCRPWDSRYWSIPNTSQVADTAGGKLGELALARLGRLPFTVSEYSISAPSDYAAETWPGLAVMAAFQDWDAVYGYSYMNFNKDYDRNFIGPPAALTAAGISDFFTMQGNPAHTGLIPFAALVYRRGLVEPARQTVTLTAAQETIVDDLGFRQFNWASIRRDWERFGQSPRVAWQHRTAVRLVAGSAPEGLDWNPPSVGTGASVSDTGQITHDPANALLTVNAPQVRLALGRLSGRVLDLGATRLRFGTLGQGQNAHAHLALVALDGQSVENSSRLLLTVLGRAENAGMGWNAARTTVGGNRSAPLPA